MEDRPGREADEVQLGAGCAKEVELVGAGRRLIDAQDDADAQPQAGEGEGAVGRSAAQSPATRVGRVHVAGRRPHHHDGRGRASRGRPLRLGRAGLADRCGRDAQAPIGARIDRGPREGHGQSVYWPDRLRRRGDHVYFYELHEGDDDLYSDVLLACDEEITPEDFFDLVQVIRRGVVDGFGEDTLIEAIAVELERSQGFIYISDARLTAAVNVSTDQDENFLIATSEDELEGVGAGADYRGVFAEYADDDDVRND